jgi:hypothetical protein
VVVEELEQVPGRVAQRIRRRARPDGGHQRDDEVADEVAPVPALAQEPAQRERFLAGRAEQMAGIPVETRHRGQGGQVLRPGDRARRREQPERAARAGVLQPAALAAHRHAHLGVPGGHPELGEQAHQMGVGAGVVHQEPAVQRQHTAVAGGDVVGVRMPAEAVLRLIQGHVVPALQQVGGGQAGHARADHGHLRPA